MVVRQTLITVHIIVVFIIQMFSFQGGGLTCDARPLDKIQGGDPMIFHWNVLFYVSLEEFPDREPYYGEFVGNPR